MKDFVEGILLCKEIGVLSDREARFIVALYIKHYYDLDITITETNENKT